MQYRWWYDRLVRNGRATPNTTYLSDMPGALGGIVVSKQVTLYNSTFMKYTSFPNYVELHYFLKNTPATEKMFHEVALSTSNQKPRFDIDISMEDYITYFNCSEQVSAEELADFGEWVKDLVVDTSIAVLKQYNVDIDVTRDFAIFTSHSSIKRSYHIVMCNLMHRGCEQAEEFYKLCGESISSHATRNIYWEFVDGGAYNKNKSLRILWCYKGDRVKVYNKTFTYKGKQYTHVHHLLSDDIPLSLYNKRLLSISLITFTSECNDMPLFPIPDKKCYESSEIPDVVLKECTSIIAVWNTAGVYEQRGCEEGKIQMVRKKPSFCEECCKTHDSRPGFCSIVGNSLYLYCGKEGAGGVPIGTLKSIVSSLDIRLQKIRKARGLDGPIVESTPEKPQPKHTAEAVFVIDGDTGIETDAYEAFHFEFQEDDEDYVSDDVHPRPFAVANLVMTEPWKKWIPVVETPPPPVKVQRQVRFRDRRQGLTTTKKTVQEPILEPQTAVNTLRGKTVASQKPAPVIVVQQAKSIRTRPK